LIVHDGVIGAWNKTVGPAIIYESPKTLDAIQKSGDPFVVIVRDKIPLKNLFSTDTRHIRGWVLARCEKDDIFSAFVVTQRRAAVRCVPGIVDDIENGDLKDGDLVAVDGVNGRVYVRPDEETVALFRELHKQPAPPITKEDLPRLAREAMLTATIPDAGPIPPLPPLPDMLDKPEWGGYGGPPVMPPDAPTPGEVKKQIQDAIGVIEKSVTEAKVAIWQAMSLVHIGMFFDRELEPDEVAIVNETVAEEYARLEEEKKIAAEAAPAELEAPEEPSRRSRPRSRGAREAEEPAAATALAEPAADQSEEPAAAQAEPAAVQAEEPPPPAFGESEDPPAA
jgi:hypothetical protein